MPKETFKGKCSLELGAGAGICGLFFNMHFTDINDILLTDGNDVVMELLQQNVKRISEQNNISHLKAMKLDWTNLQQLDSISKLYPNGIDLIFGSDICLWENAYTGMITVISTLMKHSNAQFILCYQSRSLRRERNLMKLLEEACFNVTLIEKRYLPNSQDEILLLRITRRTKENGNEHKQELL